MFWDVRIRGRGSKTASYNISGTVVEFLIKENGCGERRRSRFCKEISQGNCSGEPEWGQSNTSNTDKKKWKVTKSWILHRNNMLKENWGKQKRDETKKTDERKMGVSTISRYCKIQWNIKMGTIFCAAIIPERLFSKLRWKYPIFMGLFGFLARIPQYNCSWRSFVCFVWLVTVCARDLQTLKTQRTTQ